MPSSGNACDGEEGSDEEYMVDDDFTEEDYYKDESEALRWNS